MLVPDQGTVDSSTLADYVCVTVASLGRLPHSVPLILFSLTVLTAPGFEVFPKSGKITAV